MGRASVRSAIASWFAPAHVAGLSTTFRSRPKLIQAQDFNLSANGGSGAVLVIHLVDDDEDTLILAGGGAASKQSHHHIAMEVLFQSVKPDPQDAMDDHDALMDALMTQFRADRQFGTGGTPIWEAGPNPEGVRLEFAEPVLSKQSVIANAVVRFVVIEMAPA